MYRAIYLLLINILIWLGCSGPPSYDHLRKGDIDLFTAKEAPMLSDKVSKGELPPLNERLPETPLIAKTNYDGYDKPGKYGGQWHRFHDHPELGGVIISSIMTLPYCNINISCITYLYNNSS